MRASTERMGALSAATAHLTPPYAVVDLDAFDRNADSMVARSHGKPIRVASKSVRCRPLIERALGREGYEGILAFTLAEALWLAKEHDDVVVGYPTADLPSLRALGEDTALTERVTVMIDSEEQLDMARAALAELPSPAPVRVCLDLDASLRVAGGRVHLGVRRSPVHSVSDIRDLARAVVDDPRFRLVGVMAYEGQIAGLPNNTGPLPRRAAIRGFQLLSAQELKLRRARAVGAVREVSDLEFVNGGGTGSLESTSAEEVVTEVAAGSGLYAPTLFDGYSHFRLEPAAFFVLNVVRRPGPAHVTVLGGGWVASGPAGKDRVPKPWWPSGLSLLPEEGAGEVQTPLTGAGARDLAVGDRVWFRHAKAGEMCEHVSEVHLVSGDSVIGSVPTYRGEGRAFV
jgi:D-serine deaminase-like pyridoxal phosphate-dependent protein